MAEALGVVASGIAVGQAVGALGQAAFKIKRLCDDIGSIPEKIDHLLAELEILNPVIEGTGAALTPSGGDLDGLGNDPNASRAVVACRRASSELESAATEIQRRLSVQSGVRRKLAGLKAVLKKEEVAALEKRLESAVRVLTLIQNLHLMHLVRSHHELVMERLEVTSLVSYRSVPAPAIVEQPTPQPADISNEIERTACARNGEDESQPRSDSHVAWPEPPKSGQFIFRLAPGGFNARIVTPIMGLATQRAWEFLVSRSYLGWKVALQPFIHCPDDQLLQKLARTGAINDLQYLFTSQQAVIRDDAVFHDRMLHAGIAGGVPTVRMLLRLGFKWPRRFSDFPAAYYLLVEMWMDFRSGIDSPWLHFVFSETSWNIQDAHNTSSFWVLWHLVIAAMHAKGFLRRGMDFHSLCDRVFPDYDRVPPRKRIQRAKFWSYYPLDEREQAQIFRLSMSSIGELSSDTIVVNVKESCSLLPCEVFQWARMLVELGSAPENWTKILGDTVTLQTLTTLDIEDAFHGHTPLVGLVKGTVVGWRNLAAKKQTPSPMTPIRQALYQWLEFLQRLGIELEVYGEWELDVLRRNPEIWDHAWCPIAFLVPVGVAMCVPALHDYETPPVRLRKLFVGPQPIDWQFVWETCEEEWAGLFWSLIEAPIEQQEQDAEPRPPGSWVE